MCRRARLADCFTAGDLAGKNMIEVVKPRRPISVVITLFWNVLAVWVRLLLPTTGVRGGAGWGTTFSPPHARETAPARRGEGGGRQVSRWMPG